MKITNEFLKAIPKAELHVHLDGSIRLDTLIDLAKKQKISLPAYSIEGLKELVFKDQYRNLEEYLSGFAYTISVMQDPESIQRIAFELAEDCAREGIRYLEVRFAPQLHISNEFPIEKVFGAVSDGIDRFAKQYNTSKPIAEGDEPPFKFGIICCAMRMFRPEFSDFYRKFHEVHRFAARDELRDLASRELAMAAVATRDEYGIPIVGFDLAGTEAGYPAEDHIGAYDYVHRHFMKKTVHAGEAFGPESIFQAITDLHADRIGHGYHLYSEELIKSPKISDRGRYVEKLAEYIADRRITIEVSLTSNRQTMPEMHSWKMHTLHKFLESDLSVSICTDNRTVSNTTLTDELALACSEFSLTPKKLKNVVIYGFKRSFFPELYSAKRKYVRNVINYYEKLEKQEIDRQSAIQPE